jgi:hypothetical protein
MTNSSNTPMTYAELERLLDVYGADRTRWPVEARAGAGHLVAKDATARRLLAEAEALDRVLERAPLPSLARESALADRIAAAARRSPRMVRIDESSGEMIRTRAANVIRWPASKAIWHPLTPSRLSGAASLLVASLALGIFIGLSSLPQQVLPALQDMTGLSLGRGAPNAIAQADLLEEDLL